MTMIIYRLRYFGVVDPALIRVWISPVGTYNDPCLNLSPMPQKDFRNTIGTFPICRVSLAMSVDWGRPEVAGPRSK
jgi:hypothetical protein